MSSEKTQTIPATSFITCGASIDILTNVIFLDACSDFRKNHLSYTSFILLLVFVSLDFKILFRSYFDLANHKRLHNDGFHVCVFCNDQIEPIKSTQDLFVHEKIHHNSSVVSLVCYDKELICHLRYCFQND